MKILPLTLSALLALPALAQDADEQHWPQWRGPNLDGTSAASGLPDRWSAEENVLWRAEMPSWSGATPVVWGERVFVVSPSRLSAEETEAAEAEAERRQREAEQGGGRGRGRGRFGRGGGRSPGGNTMLLLCLSTADGARLWERPLSEGNQLYRKGNNASPSPVTDGERVWTVTGTGQINAFTVEGEPLWEANLQESYGDFGHNWGYASSPLLVDGALVVEVLHGSRTTDPSYLVCFDGASGEVRWRVERPTDAPRESPDAYTTPLLVEHAGQRQVVVSGGDYVTGHDLATGQELWRVAGLNPNAAANYRIVASPFVVAGKVVAPTRVRPLTTIDLGADFRPTGDDIAWQWNESGAPDVPTPTTDGQRIYLVNDSGMVTCVDVASGAAIWGPERTVQGTVSASPLLADGKLFVTNEEGVTVVLAAGDDFRQLAVNELDGSYTLSSPVACGGKLYLRTEKYLYCIAAQDDEEEKEAWVPLFNGKDLDGWTPKIAGHELGDNHANTFRVEDGLLKVRYDGYEDFGGKFGHLFFETPCSHYRLRVEYRFVGDQCPGGPGWAFRNSGVMLHGQSAESMARDQDFPVSIEAQMLGGRAEGVRTTGNLCTPGTHVVMDGQLVKRHCTNSKSETYRGDRWVTLELEVRGGEAIRHWHEGEVVLEYSAPQLDPDDADAARLLAAGAAQMLTGGTLSLQSESHPLDFRRVELLVLD